MSEPSEDVARPDGGAPVVATTERLRLRHFTLDDAAFVLALLTDPEFVRCIGDRGIRTETDAREYLESRLIASYATHGFGLYVVARSGDDAAIGMCGLLKRDELPDPDLGYALLPAYRRQGYVVESARAVLALARDRFRLHRLSAIVRPENVDSIRVLERLAMRLERTVRLQPEGPKLLLYARTLDSA